MRSNKLKIAFIGGGINSAVGSAHYAAINLDNIFELVAGCFSRNKNINYETANKYKVSKDRTYNDFEDLIKNEKNRIDAAVILTPQDQHFSQVLKCISNNIPVICEKSLVCSMEEIIEIKKALKHNAGFLLVIYNYLGFPIIRELKHIINSGKLGKIKHLQIEMPLESFIRVGRNDKPIVPQKWRLIDNEISTISLDLGVHLHILVKYLTNAIPINVVATSESLGNFSTVVDNINCIIEYSNNIICNMWYSKIAIGNRNGMKIRIYGEKGSAEWMQEFPEILNLADSKGRRWKIDRGNDEAKVCNQQRYTRFKVGHPAGYIEAFANYYQDIASALRENKLNGNTNFTECFGIDESCEGIQLLKAIQKSSRSNSWEKV